MENNKATLHMDIETIEQILSRPESLYRDGQRDVTPYVLLHIYKKLEAIEKKLEPPPPVMAHRSQRVY